MGEPSFCPGNVGRVPEEMRNGEEKAPPAYSIVKFPIPTQRWLLFVGLSWPSVRTGATANLPFVRDSGTWDQIGPVRRKLLKALRLL